MRIVLHNIFFYFAAPMFASICYRVFSSPRFHHVAQLICDIFAGERRRVRCSERHFLSFWKHSGCKRAKRKMVEQKSFCYSGGYRVVIKNDFCLLCRVSCMNAQILNFFTLARRCGLISQAASAKSHVCNPVGIKLIMQSCFVQLLWFSIVTSLY